VRHQSTSAFNVENGIGPDVRRSPSQELFFAVDQVTRVKARQLETMAVRDRVGRASLDTVAAEDTAVVIDVVDLGVALRAANTMSFSVLRCFNVNAIRWTRRSAQEARHTFFQTVFIALQHMHAAEALLEHGAASRPWPVGIILHNGGLEHFAEGNAHALGNGGYIPGDSHKRGSVYQASVQIALSLEAQLTLATPAL